MFSHTRRDRRLHEEGWTFIIILVTSRKHSSQVDEDVKIILATEESSMKNNVRNFMWVVNSKLPVVRRACTKQTFSSSAAIAIPSSLSLFLSFLLLLLLLRSAAMANNEVTFIMIKPDGVQRGLVSRRNFRGWFWPGFGSVLFCLWRACLAASWAHSRGYGWLLEVLFSRLSFLRYVCGGLRS